jgi:lysyl endopeptidase
MSRLIALYIFLPFLTFAQFGNKHIQPIGWERNSAVVQLSSQHVVADPVMIEKLSHAEHTAFFCATAITTDFSFSDFQLAELVPNGDKIYRLSIHSNGALGMMLNFENFTLQSGAKLWLYDVHKKNFIGEYTSKDNYTEDNTFMTSHVRGNTIIVEYLEPKNTSTPNFKINRVYHYFRGLKSTDGTGFGAAESCMLNANCSEGDGREDANAATCRIKVTFPGGSGFCTGTLLNNTAEDLTPYIITANHCSQTSSLSDLINWEFNFLYQTSGCSNSFSEPSSIDFKGCTAPAYSGTDNGENSSDFLLLKLKSTLSSYSHDFTFLGWNRSNSNYTNNYCFHHPAGDVKKVSRAFGPTIFASYKFADKSHLQVYWSSTTHGHSVTEGGSSGSGLINSSGELVGTLTGGSSKCSAQNEPDLFGRFYMHWDKFGPAANQRLAPWLDPLNTGTTSLRTTKSTGAVMSINSKNQLKEITMNVENNQLNLSWSGQKFNLVIYNAVGQSIAHFPNNSQRINIDMSSFPKGIYLLELENNHSKQIKKLAW